MMQVFDTYADGAKLHLDLHTYVGDGTNLNFATWIFTDDKKLGERGAVSGQAVVQAYAAKYPDVPEFKKHYGGAVNIETTSSSYLQSAYGIPAGTIEARGENADLAPAGVSQYASSVALLHDIMVNTIVSMFR